MKRLVISVLTAVFMGSAAYAAAPVNDAYYDKQWGFSNDGSFNIEDISEDLAIYINPFSNPSGVTYWKSRQSDTEEGGGSVHISINAADVSVSATRVKRGIDIRAEEAWKLLHEGEETVVAVIDTGIDYTHPDLEPNIWTNPKEIPSNGIDDDENGYIDDIHGWNFVSNSNKIFESSKDNHGTHCAGTIAAVSGNGRGIAGLAGDGSVKVMSIKVLSESGDNVSVDAMVRAIRYAEENGARVCNMSMGTTAYSTELYRAVEESGMLFVTSAGNGANWTANGINIDERPVYPACFECDNIITAANLHFDGGLNRTSNYGVKSVDIAAPGTYILSTTTNGTYSYMNGTSMAAPMVSAAAALLFSQNPDMDAVQVKEAILNSARTLPALKDCVATGGMLDAGAALKYTSKTLSEDGVFSDIKHSWAKEYIEAVYAAGILNGTGDGKFSPNKAMTRGMAASMLYRMRGEPATEWYTGFEDVTEHSWYADAVSWAYREGIISGYGNGKFGGEDYLRREQLCQMMYMYARKYMNLNPADYDISIWTDEERVSQWAREAVGWAASKGNLHCTSGRLRPASIASRADAAAMAAQLLSEE